MGELKDLVIAAHGGLDRWNQLSEVRAHLLIGGVAWALKKQDGVIQDTMVLVELRRQFASYYAFGKTDCARRSPQIGSRLRRRRGR